MKLGTMSDRAEGGTTGQNSFLAVPGQIKGGGVADIMEASQSRNEWEETLGESQLVAASHSLKPRAG